VNAGRCSTSELLAEWIEKAEEDYLAAQTLIRRKGTPTPNAVCFLSQQCVEKYLKALLFFEERDFPKTHDLGFLLGLAVKEHGGLEFYRSDFDFLNAYSVTVRYPGDSAIPEEAREAVRKMKILRMLIRAELGIHKKTKKKNKKP
jgi:HEPN domain-containing protein